MVIRNWLASVIVGMCVLVMPAGASDVAKEQRWAADIVDALIDGEAVWLKAEQHKFLGIYTESSAKKIKGAAIVLHGIGVHPNWSSVVYPLRVQLPEHGWHTLSLQMPILRNEADYKEYTPLFKEIAPRLNAGIAYLKARGINNIVVVGHSLGSTMAAHFLATNKVPEVSAFVAVGVSGIEFNDPELGYFNS
ncbi:MAG: alpha/beta hydrolase family protein, partial [Gammaproteobacteria bacterium]|nr:alpha/beta hydrolase family protein [Gammaproteobacteria bacterium]